MGWKDGYGVGDRKMGGRHKGLIGLINARDGSDKLRDGIQSCLRVWLINPILFTDKACSSCIK